MRSQTIAAQPHLFQVGQSVKVVAIGDEMDKKYLGMTGTITEIDTSTAGVGESKTDPYITVRFSPGDRDGFWKEELQIL